MRKILIYLSLLLIPLIFAQSIVFAQEEKIKFNKETFNLISYTEKPPEYEYYANGENKDKWHKMITLKNFPELSSPTEASANYAHQIQEKNPGAAVLVYPDIAMVEYINFPESRDYYEYNALVYSNSEKKGLDMFKYTQRFYANENDGAENARKAAISFAEKNSVKYMDMVNKTAEKYKVE